MARTLKPTSIANYLNIIRILHLEAQFINPLAENFAVQNLRKGITRRLGSPPKQMLPFTCEMLLKILDGLCLMLPKDIAFWAACCVGFFGFLRKATLLPISGETPGDACLLYGDLEFQNPNNFVIKVRRTKTIQCNERVLLLPYTAYRGSRLCPITALANLLEVSPKQKNLPLFAYRNKGVVNWWTHSTFSKYLKVILQRAGCDAGAYSCHSFRRGGATLAFRLGMTITEIKRRGDWRSSAVDEYVFLDSDQDKYIASRLIHGAATLVECNM